MRLKNRASIVIIAVTILFLIAIGITPVTVMAKKIGGQDGRGGGPGDPCAGQFKVIMGTSTDCYRWVEGWQQGKTLAEPVSLVGTCYASPGTEYKIEIPEGTVVEGYYPTQQRPIHLEIKIVSGQLHFSPNMKLSQPATLYKQVDGEWVEELSFTEVLNGKAS